MAAVDAIFGRTAQDLPKVLDDAVASVAIVVEELVPPVVRPLVSGVLEAGTAALHSGAISQLDQTALAALALAQGRVHAALANMQKSLGA